MSAGDVTEVVRQEFRITQPAVSQHLKVLRENGFALVRPEGTRRLYSVDAGPLQETDAWLDRFRHFWTPHLDALATELARGKRERRLPAEPEPARRTGRGRRDCRTRHLGCGQQFGSRLADSASSRVRRSNASCRLRRRLSSRITSTGAMDDGGDLDDTGERSTRTPEGACRASPAGAGGFGLGDPARRPMDRDPRAGRRAPAGAGGAADRLGKVGGLLRGHRSAARAGRRPNGDHLAAAGSDAQPDRRGRAGRDPGGHHQLGQRRAVGPDVRRRSAPARSTCCWCRRNG